MRLYSGRDGGLDDQGIVDKELCLDGKLRGRGSQGSVADRIRGGGKDGWSAGVDGVGGALEEMCGGSTCPGRYRRSTSDRFLLAVHPE